MKQRKGELDRLIDHLFDLYDQSQRYYCHMESKFLNEEELEVAKVHFKESELIHYDGGYLDACKQKIIFRSDSEDDFSDIVCLKAHINQTFVKITHRDILGSIMALQVDRSSFGDIFVKDDAIYIYTSESMGRFFMQELTQISKLNVKFAISDEHVAQEKQYKKVEVILSSLRLDVIVASLANCSRNEASEMIRLGNVQVNHRTLYDTSYLCNNNNTISIRRVGRFVFVAPRGTTRKNRIIAEFLQAV